MTDNFIKLSESNTLKLRIQDSEGKDTGEFLEFDLEDIELPLKYQQIIEEDKKNKQNLRNQLLIIEKREDVKGKKLMSRNEEDKIKAVNEFFKKEVDVYDLFLGEGGVRKLLNGRKLGWTTLSEIDDIITKQITPYLNTNMEDISKKVKEKYAQVKKANDEVEVLE